MDLLCRFSLKFPPLAAEILERDQYKKRNFREETITDILMAGLVPFEPFGILTDFPKDEAATGEDMDWEFVNEFADDGQRYLRLHIQAKRAHLNRKVKSPYWEYRELDHVGRAAASSTPGSGGKKYGKQHKLLIEQAAITSGCVPLYMFYHPRSALDPRSVLLPAVEGVNWMFADRIPVNISSKRWPVNLRKVKKWRPFFHPLSDLLCFTSKWGADEAFCPVHSVHSSL